MAEENVKHKADDGVLDIDMGDHEAAEVEVEASDDVQEVVQEVVQEESEQEQVTNSAQKRINQLTKKMREMERREKEALRYAQQVQQESTNLKNRIETLDQGYMSEYGSRLDIETANAEALLQRAVEVGDAEKTVEAQKQLTRLYNQKQQFDQAKVAQDHQRTQQQAAAQYQQQQQQIAAQQAAQQPQQPDRKATQWAEKNEWFGQDEAMTFAAFGIHKKLVEEEGFDPRSDEYYSELDNRLASRFPELGGNAVKTGTGKRNVQTVAGVSRSTTGASSGRSKRVKLSPTQVAIAKKLGVPLEQYAKYVKEQN